MLDLDDTIAAIATATGAAGLAVVRVSGSSALTIADAVFEGARLSQAPGHTLHHGWAAWPQAAEAPPANGVAAAGHPASTAPDGSVRAARVRLDEVVAGGGELMTEYLNAQERRIVHVTLREDARVKTYALGTDMIKRVAIAPADFEGGPRDERD